MPTFTPPVVPSTGTVKQTNARILRAEFGDGYSQRSGDGLNSINRSVNVTWTILSVADADTIEAFFEARGGHESFDWTPPRGASPLKWIVTSWSRDFAYGENDTMTATFEQVHDL